MGRAQVLGLRLPLLHGGGPTYDRDGAWHSRRQPRLLVPPVEGVSDVRAPEPRGRVHRRVRQVHLEIQRQKRIPDSQ